VALPKKGENYGFEPMTPPSTPDVCGFDVSVSPFTVSRCAAHRETWGSDVLMPRIDVSTASKGATT
jgi:hypothetical protein